MDITGIFVELAAAGTTRYLAEAPGTGSNPSWPEGRVRVGPLETEIALTSLGSGTLLSARILNAQRSHCVVRRVGFQLGSHPRRVLETGYQSWSPIRRCDPSDLRPLRRLQPLMARGCFHADPDRAGRVVAGDQYLLWESAKGGGAACFLETARHLSTIEAGESASGGMIAWALLDRIVLESGEDWTLDPLWFSEGEPGTLYSELAGHWGQRSGARIERRSAAPVERPGWCSWYHYFFRVSPADLRHNLNLAREAKLGLMVLDDGYAAAVGDWLTPSTRWSSPGDTPWDLASEIASARITPGIWTAPFFAGRKSAIAREHPEWIVRGRKGALPQPMTYNPVSWGGWIFGLDTTQPAVLDHLRRTYASLVERGYTYHKIDFCFGATMPGRRQGDGKLTRAQGLRAGLQAIREGIGDDAYLLGCGCPFGPAVGLVDAMRVSPDVAPWWSPNLLAWPAYKDAGPAAVNAVRASVLRAPLHRRLFANDPDCLLLRPTKTRLSATQRQVLADTVAGTGAFMVLSDDLALYGQAERKILASIAAWGDSLDSPLDIDDPFSRTVTVKSRAAKLEVDWQAPRSELTAIP